MSTAGPEGAVAIGATAAGWAQPLNISNSPDVRARECVMMLYAS
jgi:hypothetical protein